MLDLATQLEVENVLYRRGMDLYLARAFQTNATSSSPKGDTIRRAMTRIAQASAYLKSMDIVTKDNERVYFQRRSRQPANPEQAANAIQNAQALYAHSIPQRFRQTQEYAREHLQASNAAALEAMEAIWEGDQDIEPPDHDLTQNEQDELRRVPLQNYPLD